MRVFKLLNISEENRREKAVRKNNVCLSLQYVRKGIDRINQGPPFLSSFVFMWRSGAFPGECRTSSGLHDSFPFTIVRY